MSAASRRKGKVGELELVTLLKENGFDCWRTPNSGAMHYAKGDINGLPGLHIECKRAERIEIQKWVDQSLLDCPAGLAPVVVWRASRHAWRADLPLIDFLPMYRARLRAREFEQRVGVEA